ncbi:MAG: hypothetical protein ABEJ98_05335 [Candidatus Nanohaloarchaea archaeon]
MKGQFMMISSVIIGLIVMSAAGTISDLQAAKFDTDQTGYTVKMIKSEAAKIDTSSVRERQNFVKMVEMIDSYHTRVSYSPSKSCFNVTLRRTDEVLRLRCIS